jgi:hypothetical protein
MKRYLSADSPTTTYLTLGGSFILIVVILLLVGLSDEVWPTAMYVLWSLLVIGRAVHRLTFYQVTLTGNTLLLTRIFSQPVSYSAACFVSIESVAVHGKPLRMCFKDGHSFKFLPKLKSNDWSIYYMQPADFIERWSRIIKGLAAVERA